MQALLTKLDLAKFPFTKEASEYVKSRNIQPLELVEPEFTPILDRAIDRIKQTIFGGRISPEMSVEDVDILAYPTALMLISVLGNDRVRRRYALAEAKRASQLLRNESPEKILHIAITSFNWDARIDELDLGRSHFELALHFEDYVRNSARIHDLKWKLVNRVVSRGYVLLPREDFARLLEEEVQARVLEKTSDLNVMLPKELEGYVQPLRAIVEARASYFAAEEMPRTAMPEAMPPCMKNLLSLLQTSKHISHMGRFAMTTFLLGIGTTEEGLLTMFKSFTDFDERIARYQVEHIAGRRGSRTKYTAPNCSTMRTHGLCVNPDELCAAIIHPLSYYRKKTRILLRKRRGDDAAKIAYVPRNKP
jgi:DNA primase large subunit